MMPLDETTAVEVLSWWLSRNFDSCPPGRVPTIVITPHNIRVTDAYYRTRGPVDIVDKERLAHLMRDRRGPARACGQPVDNCGKLPGSEK